MNKIDSLKFAKSSERVGCHGTLEMELPSGRREKKGDSPSPDQDILRKHLVLRRSKSRRGGFHPGNLQELLSNIPTEICPFLNQRVLNTDFELLQCLDCHEFRYANNFFYHLNFEARPHSSGDVEPSTKLFFAEVISRRGFLVTCCRVLEPTNKGFVQDMARCLLGVLPWQLNTLPAIQASDICGRGPPSCQSAEEEPWLRRESLLEEYKVLKKNRLWELSRTALEYLKKGKVFPFLIYIVIKGLEFHSFQYARCKFYHLNFEAKLQSPDLSDHSTRLCFAEVMNQGGDEHVTFCCMLDPEDKEKGVLERH